MSLIPALERVKQAELYEFGGQPDLHSKTLSRKKQRKEEERKEGKALRWGMLGRKE